MKLSSEYIQEFISNLLEKIYTNEESVKFFNKIEFYINNVYDNLKYNEEDKIILTKEEATTLFNVGMKNDDNLNKDEDDLILNLAKEIDKIDLDNEFNKKEKINHENYL